MESTWLLALPETSCSRWGGLSAARENRFGVMDLTLSRQGFLVAVEIPDTFLGLTLEHLVPPVVQSRPRQAFPGVKL
jgi:hypothetical protein